MSMEVRSVNHEASKFLESCQDAFFTQNILQPTRHRVNQQKNILDLLFTFSSDEVENTQYLPPLRKSDHLCLRFNLNSTPKKLKIDRCTRKNYNRGDFVKISEKLTQDLPVNDLEELDVEQCWLKIKSSIIEAENMFVPSSKNAGQKNTRSPLWMNRNTMSKIRKKRKAWSKYLRHHRQEDYDTYTQASNAARRETRKAMKQFEKNIAKEAKKNPKAFWKYCRSKTVTRSKFPDQEYSINGTTKKTANNHEKVEVFNTYFAGVFTKEDITYIPEPPAMLRSITSITSIEITPETVAKKLKALPINKAMGPDQIHPRILHEAADTLSVSLAHLFDKTLKAGKIPGNWKEAHVKPIHKKGTTSKAENFRPVSLTSCVCKVMESIVRDKVMLHLLDNNIISPDQHGFVKGKSTNTQLAETLNDWTTYLDNNETFDVVFLDFKKAFDKVTHKRLLKKVENYGIRGKLLDWISDFLANRKQAVCIDGDLSGC
ncbi:uncharacterized protein LOC141907764 [Tubulanus polymorphus]|uniref:uncharacterized protein LOC141907764 n=1 Tax=Tubulanus polymorphus TaxID=672921 RepID=UPI003DA1EF3E